MENATLENTHVGGTARVLGPGSAGAKNRIGFYLVGSNAGHALRHVPAEVACILL